MLRFFYRWLVRFHPPRFRERFADEMLSIFDHAEARDSGKLVADVFISLARQWTIRRAFWEENVAPSAPAGAHGFPAFSILESSKPRKSALIEGVVLAWFAYAALFFALSHSKLHYVYVPSVAFEKVAGAEVRIPASGTNSTPTPGSLPTTTPTVSEAGTNSQKPDHPSLGRSRSSPSKSSAGSLPEPGRFHARTDFMGSSQSSPGKSKSSGPDSAAGVFQSMELTLGAAPAWPQATVPDGPAGQTLAAWLRAFNSGDRAQMEEYCQKYDANQSADGMMSFRNMTGGFELIQVVEGERLHLKFLVKERNSDTQAIGSLDVKDAEPAEVVQFGLRAIPPGTSISDLTFKVDAATRSRIIDASIAQLNESYVFPEVAKKMEVAVRARQKQGEYDAINDGNAFAAKLTENFQEVSHDKHLRVDYSPAKIPDRPLDAKPSPKDKAQYRQQMEHMNCGFEKLEHLDGNIGYVKFNMFADPDVCGPTAVAAMNFLGYADAIIFDLRENGGGDPKMIALISTYLFEQPTHLNDLWERKDNSTHQYWTLPYVPGKRLEGKAVYILTSKQTFSGAEEFSYNLKNLKRATLIGETTGGGAHPVSGHRIGDHFTIGVPFARAINPISKTNWEGTGVEPDVKVPAAEALATAERLAHDQKIPK
jgi:retinol-binding protein 3